MAKLLDTDACDCDRTKSHVERTLASLERMCKDELADTLEPTPERTAD